MQLRSTLLACFLACAFADELLQGARELAAPVCTGQLVSRVIDFDTAASGIPFRAGDTPFQLPFGVTVGEDQNGQALNNLVSFDSSSPTGSGRRGNLRSTTEGMVLVVNGKKQKQNPLPSKSGGDVRFEFAEPVHSIDRNRFLNIRKMGESYVFAPKF